MSEPVIYTSTAFRQSRRLAMLIVSALYSLYNGASTKWRYTDTAEISKDFIDITRSINILFSPEDPHGMMDSAEVLTRYAATFDLENRITGLICHLRRESIISDSFKVKIITDDILPKPMEHHIKRLFSEIVKFENPKY